MKKVAFVCLSPLLNIPASIRINMPGIPSLWMLSLASYLKEAAPGIKIKILDNQLLPIRNIFFQIKKEKFDIVALSPLLNNYKENLEIARFSKKCGCRVVVGGLYATALRKEIVTNRGAYSHDYCIDVVIQKDGDKAFYEYVSGKPLPEINNAVYLERNGKVRENPIELPNLDDLPSIDYRLIDLKKYFSIQGSWYKNMVAFLSHRGCPWRERSKGCIFCSLYDERMRFKSPEKVWREIKGLTSRYNVRQLFDTGDDFLGRRSWFNDLCRISSSVRNKPKWRIFTRSSAISPKTVQMFKIINVAGVILGIETFENKTLKNLKYGLTVENHKRAIALLEKAGILPLASIILGGPGENKKSLETTMREVKTLLSRSVEVSPSFLVPLPGSPAWFQILEKEKKYHNRDLIDIRELISDWVKNFCQINISEIADALEEIFRIHSKRTLKDKL